MFDSRPVLGKLLATIGAFFLCVSLTAQEYGPRDQIVVSYKDGSIFKGRLLESSSYGLKMIISTGDTINLNTGMILKIFDPENYIVTKKDKFHYRTGVFGYGALTFGSNKWDNSAQIQGIVGYRHTESLSLGLGLSLEGHDISVADNWFYHRYISSFGYSRYYLNNKNWRLYTDAKMGYSFAIDADFFERNTSEDGFLFQPGLGVHLASRNKVKMHFGMSYLFLRTKGQGSDWSGDIQFDYRVWISRLVFSLGFELW